MKFFLSQMEMSKEAVRVGTLTLIRAVVSADGEQDQEAGGSRGKRVSACLDLRQFLFCRHYWLGRGLSVFYCFTFSVLEPKQHCDPCPPPPTVSSNPESWLPPESEFLTLNLRTTPQKLNQRLYVRPSYIT